MKKTLIYVLLVGLLFTMTLAVKAQAKGKVKKQESGECKTG